MASTNHSTIFKRPHFVVTWSSLDHLKSCRLSDHPGQWADGHATKFLVDLVVSSRIFLNKNLKWKMEGTSWLPVFSKFWTFLEQQITRSLVDRWTTLLVSVETTEIQLLDSLLSKPVDWNANHSRATQAATLLKLLKSVNPTMPRWHTSENFARYAQHAPTKRPSTC